MHLNPMENVVVLGLADGTINVAAGDPLASMQSIRNPELQLVAEEIQLKLKKVIAQLQG